MPRRRPQSTEPTLTSGQAEYVVNRMLAERRISSAEIDRYVSGMQEEIREIEVRLERLRAAAEGRAQSESRGPTKDRLGVPPGRKRRGRPPGRPRGRRPGRPSKSAKSQQLQGRYLGLIRQIPAGKRAQYSAIAKDKGRESAIKEMESALGK
jgi:hypothetical protein